MADKVFNKVGGEKRKMCPPFKQGQASINLAFWSDIGIAALIKPSDIVTQALVDGQKAIGPITEYAQIAYDKTLLMKNCSSNVGQKDLG